MPVSSEQYEQHKARVAQRSRDASAAGREISHDYPGTGRPWPQTGDADEFATAFKIASPSVAAALFEALTGKWGMVALLGLRKSHAMITLADVRRQLESNPLLLDAFPEAIYPIRRLDGIPQRRLIFNGESIGAELRPDLLRLPLRPSSPAAGCRLVAIKKNTRPKWMEPQWFPEFGDDNRPHIEIDV